MGHNGRDGTGGSSGGFLGGRSGLVLLGFLAIAAFLLLSEHRAHLLGFLPWLLLLACPLMHLFMHGGHGGGERRADRLGGSAGPEPHRH
jgi:hypothetical protein